MNRNRKVYNKVELQSNAVWNHLERIVARGFSSGKVFHDWLDLMLFGLQGNDPEYLRTLEPYQDKREQGERNADIFASAFRELVIQLKENCTDILGQIFTVHITRGENGQFFTPEVLCDFISMITAQKDDNSSASINDPACGSGRTLIAAIKHKPCGWYIGTDLDARCAKMTVLNMLFRNVNSLIVHGNSLTLEVWNVWETKHTVSGGVFIQYTPEQVVKFKQKFVDGVFQNSEEQCKNELIPTLMPNKNGQYSFF